MNSDEIFELISFNINQIVPELHNGKLERTAFLSPLGLDSVGRAELIEQTLEDLHLNVPRCNFYAARNLGELADMFAQKLSEVFAQKLSIAA